LLEQDPAVAQKRINLAGNNTWAIRVESIMEMVLGKIKEKRLT
jgi:hypothetical protein